MAPFSFPAYDGGEEVRAAPHVFIPNLNQKIIQLLEENDRYEMKHFMLILSNVNYIALGNSPGMRELSLKVKCGLNLEAIKVEMCSTPLK